MKEKNIWKLFGKVLTFDPSPIKLIAVGCVLMWLFAGSVASTHGGPEATLFVFGIFAIQLWIFHLGASACLGRFVWTVPVQIFDPGTRDTKARFADRLAYRYSAALRLCGHFQ